MNMNQDLEGQTAPESTRGFFDTDNTLLKRTTWIDKCRPIESNTRNNKSFTPTNNSRSRTSTLDTVTEEGQSQEPVQRNNKYMDLFQRKQRSSVVHFNNFPLIKQEEPEDCKTRADVLAETEAKLSGFNRYYSNDSPQKKNRRLSEPNTRVYHQDKKLEEKRLSKTNHLSLDLNKRRSLVVADWRKQAHRYSTGSIESGHQRKPLFASHLPFSSVIPHLKSNTLMSGLMRVNKRNRSDAYVFCEELNADIYICGSRDRNRALEGDYVAVKLIEVDQVMEEKHEKEEAKLARNNGQPIIRKPDEEDEKEIIFGGEEDVDRVIPRFCGVVVAILDRAQKQVFSGTLGLTRPSNIITRNGYNEDQQPTSAPRIIWFKPTDKRVPLIAIPIEQAPVGFIENSELYENRLFLGSIKRWPITSLHPFGVLESELGSVKETSVQLKAILADNNLTHSSYSDITYKSIPVHLLYSESIEKEIKNNRRIDLRSTLCIAIQDEEGFRENALSISVEEEGYKIGLHVSDISAFVTPDSQLDNDGKTRAVDVYPTLSERVPLWPDVLREQYTDLIQDQDRLAFSVVWSINKKGEISDTWFGRTVINVNALYTDAEVQESEDENIFILYQISQKLRQKRTSLFIQKPKLNIEVTKLYEPVSIKTTTRNSLLTEYQILANEYVAHKISCHFPDHALLRSQLPPNDRKLKEVKAYLMKLGYSIDISSPSSIQQSIEAVTNEEARFIITTLVMKTMNAKKYFCTGVFDISRYHHYSINTPLYTHFTCPSRRYSDVIVHRQLSAYLNNEATFYLDSDAIQKIAQHCNVKTKALEQADEQMQHMFSSLYLTGNTGNSRTLIKDAIVVGVQEGAFDVIIPDLGLERRIHTINLPLKSDTYRPGENVLHLVWLKGSPQVDVELVNVSSSVDSGSESETESDVILVDIEEPKEENTNEIQQTVHQLSIKDYEQKLKKKKRPLSIRVSQDEEDVPKERLFPNEYRQLICPFDFVKVVIVANATRTPPLLRVLAANPFLS
ncbi:hypothetical protein BDB01DRAFT_849565 [Pilobolus umbonatus]|nr:hypothetical protein BDB01DRAFT_849565 [Pilobolus umbonatus]